MERQLARGELREEARAQFSFALAKALEDRGEYRPRLRTVRRG